MTTLSYYVIDIARVLKKAFAPTRVLRNTRINADVNSKRKGNVMPINIIPLWRAVPVKPQPLGLYFRPGSTEHSDVLAVLESGRSGFFGAAREGR
jgi:hypothetical protein